MDPTVYSLKGNLVFDHGLPAAGIITRLYTIGFAGQDTKIGEFRTDPQGNYAFNYQYPAGQSPSIQVRVLDPQNNEVTISTTKFNAQNQEVLNLTVPARVQPLAAEYQRLAADMVQHLDGINRLGQAQENAQRQDLTLVNRTTNWDARLLALAATAAQQTATTGMGQDVLYALYRVGLPTDADHLAMVPSATVEQALLKASKAGIVSMNTDQIKAASTAFGNFAIKTRLAATGPGAVSKFNDFLTTTVPAAAQPQFANIYFSQPAGGAAFWQQVGALQLPAGTVDTLRSRERIIWSS